MTAMKLCRAAAAPGARAASHATNQFAAGSATAMHAC